MTGEQFSLLSGEEIEANGLVAQGDKGLFRASTYDLSVGDIILAGAKVWEGSTYALEPGGMVRVISKESLHLPNTITGHVLLKNDLCTKGVLAINIGVVDPGYEGQISSTLINFGREKFPVEKGTAFLRVSFHRCPQSPVSSRSLKYDRAGYLKQVKQEVLAYSGPDFLNIDATAKKAAVKVFGSFKQALVLWAGVLAVVVAVLAIFAPIGASLVDKYLVRSEQQQIQLEQKVEQNVEQRYETRLKDLSDEVDHLKRASAATTKERNGSSRTP